ncbi:WXG100 family type VII secretion target [Streptomyces sp. LaBMicrA B280]|uniref:WXG100 family type VII secretion target n=1 Tax=Streptomyces sp. LaBMicrA B280 TaxID=3391001 RepID=UPI003BA6997C
MADGEFYVDTAGLRNQLPYVQQLAARFRDIGKGLEGRLSELGECWGEDATGRQFYEQYATPRKQIIDSTGQMGQLVDSMHDGIRTMAVNLERMEDQNVEATRRLHTSDVPPTETRVKNTKS